VTYLSTWVPPPSPTPPLQENRLLKLQFCVCTCALTF